MKCITSKFNEGGKDANLRAEGYISDGPSGHCRSWRLGTEQGRDGLMLPVRSHSSMNYGLMK
jgi:hypothetical protein